MAKSGILFKIYFIILILVFIECEVSSKKKERRRLKKQAKSKALQCYNCLSYDHPGCWDPEHPDMVNYTIPSTECYHPEEEFTCILVIAEQAKLVDYNQEIGPVKARTCVPGKEFRNRNTLPYSVCDKISRELAESEVFSRVRVKRPKCVLCSEPYCTGEWRADYKY